MQALSCRSAAARRCVLQQAAKRPLVGSHHHSPATLPLLAGVQASQLHASAPALGGGTPGEWNHVHQWKTRAKLAAMKEAALAAEGKGEGVKEEEKQAAAKGAQGGGIAALPGEKVLVLDENLPDGALEEYFAGLRSSKGGDAGAAAGAEAAAGKPKRRTIKKHMLFGWNYKRSDKGAAGAAAAAAAGAGKPSQPKKAAAAGSSE